MRHLETENKISVADERTDSADQCPVLIKLMLYITELRGGGHNKAAFSVRTRNKIQCDTGAR